MNEYEKVNVHGELIEGRMYQMLKDIGAAVGFDVLGRISQGSFSTDVSASGNTHAGGGAIDVSIRGLSEDKVKKLVLVMRQHGLLAWHRTESQGFDSDHIHALDLGSKTLSDAAQNQVDDWRAGGNGLKGDARDDGPKVNITPYKWGGPATGDKVDPEDVGLSRAIVDSDPELKRLWNDYLNDPNMTLDLFDQRLFQTNWWKTHSSAQRNAQVQAGHDPATYAANIDQMRVQIQRQAVALGAQISDHALDSLARAAFGQGWNSDQIINALASYVQGVNGSLVGSAGDTEDQLRQYQAAMGTNFSKKWLQNMATQIATGQASLQEGMDQIKQQAIGMFPSLAKQLQAGQTVADVASPYMATMANLLELPGGQITLRDPQIRKALMSTDHENNPVLTPLWQFERQVKNDPRWLKTDNARNDTLDVVTSLGRDWGFLA